jgi:amino acid adenylation domain-containing protein
MSKDKLANLTPAQRDLLLKRLAQRAAAQKVSERKPRSEGPIPLSFAQERQFFQDQMSPKDASHIIIGALKLDGELNVLALRKALDAIYQKHEPLRARFSLNDQGVQQATREKTSVPFEVIKINTEHDFQRIYKEQCGQGFDLAKDKLLRATLMQMNPAQNWLIFSMHHISSDGWSIGVFLKELLANYRDAVTGTLQLTLPEFTYGDFARWQRGQMDAGRSDAGINYWRDQLSNPPAVLEILSDTKDEFTRDYSGESLEFVIDEALKRKIASVATRAGTSVFSAVLAGFMTLLNRLSTQDDIVVGTPVSGRSKIETEGLIGLFLNTVPLRMTFSKGQTFAEILAQTKTKVLDGLNFQDVPFEKIVQNVTPQRSTRDHPLFEIFFNYTPSPPRVLDMAGLSAQYVEPTTLRSDFSMSLYVTDWEDHLELRLVYQKKMYTKRRMELLLKQYVSLLEQVIEDPSQPISEVSLLLDKDKKNQISFVEQTVPEQIPVPKMIEDCARKTPSSIAIEDGTSQLTYDQVRDAMNGYALGLRAKGVRKGDVVAISGDRSVLYVIAMAAVLRAGAVLVTLSNDLPFERIERMLKEARAKFIWQTDLNNLDVSCPSVLPECLYVKGIELPAAPCGVRDPAYIFFTSGSTGKPKAVQGTAGGLAHFLTWQRTEFEIGPSDRCAQLTAMSFDVVLRDVFLPLVSGATLVLPPPDRNVTSGRTLEWLSDAKISMFHTVPSIVDAWLSIEQTDKTFPSLKRVFFAGEPLTDTLVRAWRALVGDVAQIVNLYGPTETTLAKQFHVVQEVPFAGVQPLGVSIPNTEVIVLTKSRQLCGVGELGEIAIRTPFRSLGYLNDNDATARQFVPNHFSKDAGDLLYLTGDFGHHDANGLLRYNGRADDQVKIRGVRIEPAEVNAALARHKSISGSYVAVQKDGPNGPQLVAYVVPKKFHILSDQELREYLQASLPAPMVPSAFCFLEALPLNANNKIDRQSLPKVDDVLEQFVVDHQAPRTDAESKLAKIWEEVLNITNPSVTADFFGLGGHSLLSLRLLAKMESDAGIPVTLSEFLKKPTIEAIAALVDVEQGDPLTVVLSMTPNLPTLFLVHTGGGTVLNYRPLSENLKYHLNIIAFQADGIASNSHPQADITEMARDYIKRLRAVQPQGPYLLGGHSFGGVIAYEMAHQLRANGDEVEHLVLFDTILDQKDENHDILDSQSQNAKDLFGAIDIYRRFTGIDVPISLDELSALPIANQFKRLEQILPLNVELNDDVIKRFVSVAQAHRRARSIYIMPPMSLKTTLFRASSIALTGIMPQDVADFTLGWGKLLSNTLTVIDAEGDHVTMMAETNVDNLATQVKCALGAR